MSAWLQYPYNCPDTFFSVEVDSFFSYLQTINRVPVLFLLGTTVTFCGLVSHPGKLENIIFNILKMIYVMKQCIRIYFFEMENQWLNNI